MGWHRPSGLTKESAGLKAAGSCPCQMYGPACSADCRLPSGRSPGEKLGGTWWGVAWNRTKSHVWSTSSAQGACGCRQFPGVQKPQTQEGSPFPHGSSQRPQYPTAQSWGGNRQGPFPISQTWKVRTTGGRSRWFNWPQPMGQLSVGAECAILESSQAGRPAKTQLGGRRLRAG